MVGFFARIRSLSMEKQSVTELHLVFNRDGNDPLVLESWWSGAGNRERPDLLNVGRSETTVRALCILFLLAKSNQSGSFLQNGVLLFQTKIKKGTWICTLANKPNATSTWVKNHFFIRDSQLFLSASAGSTHNKRGRKPPSVEFKTQRLPLANLHLYLSSPNPSSEQPRLLQDGELISFARKLEEKHWLNSAIEMLYPGFAAMSSRAESTGVGSAEKAKNLECALLAAFAERVFQDNMDSRSTQDKIKMDELFQALLERDIEVCRNACNPFFAYVRNMSGGAKTSEPNKGRIWNKRQTSMLAANAYQFCDVCMLQMLNCLKREEFSKLRFIQLPFVDYRGFTFRHNHAASHVFYQLWASQNPNTRLIESGAASDPSMIVPEFEKLKGTLVWGVENRNRSIAIGALMAMRVAFVDFLENVCLPLDPKFSRYRSVGEYRSGCELEDLPAKLREEINKSKDLAQSYCDYPMDFNDAWQIARQALNAQANFWKALHRLLVSVE